MNFGHCSELQPQILIRWIQMQKRRSTKSALNPIEIFIVLLCMAGMAASLILFERDLSVSLSNSSGAPIATIYFKMNTAQRRLKDRNLWEQLKETSPIYDGDRIRTAALSEAYTVFDDGSKIELHENSLVQVFGKKDKNSLEFIKGSISISSPINEENFSVRTGDKILSFNENTTAVIRMPKSGTGKATIAVTSGAIKVTNVTPVEGKLTAPKSIISKVTKAVAQTVAGSEATDVVEALQTISAGSTYSYVPM